MNNIIDLYSGPLAEASYITISGVRQRVLFKSTVRLEADGCLVGRLYTAFHTLDFNFEGCGPTTLGLPFGEPQYIGIDGVEFEIDGSQASATQTSDGLLLEGFLTVKRSGSDDSCECDRCEEEDDDWSGETDPDIDLPVDYEPTLPRIIEMQEPEFRIVPVGETVFFNSVEYRLTAACVDGLRRFERVE